MDVTTGPLLYLSQGIHHSRAGSGMIAREVLGYVGGGSYTTTLRRMLLHAVAVMWCICGIALKRNKQEATCDSVCRYFQQMETKKKSHQLNVPVTVALEGTVGSASSASSAVGYFAKRNPIN